MAENSGESLGGTDNKGVSRQQYLEKLQAELEEVREQMDDLANGGSVRALRGVANKAPIKMGYLVSGGFAAEFALVAILYVWAVYVDPPVDKIEILLRLVGLAVGAVVLGYVSRALLNKYRKRELIERLQERENGLREQIEGVQAQLGEES